MGAPRRLIADTADSQYQLGRALAPSGWNDVKVRFRLVMDEDGRPPAGVESPWGGGPCSRQEIDGERIRWAGETVRASEDCAIRLIVLKDGGAVAAPPSVLTIAHASCPVTVSLISVFPIIRSAVCGTLPLDAVHFWGRLERQENARLIDLVEAIRKSQVKACWRSSAGTGLRTSESRETAYFFPPRQRSTARSLLAACRDLRRVGTDPLQKRVQRRCRAAAQPGDRIRHGRRLPRADLAVHQAVLLE